MLRVAFFGGSGEASTSALGALSKIHRVVAVVSAGSPSPLRRTIRFALSRSGLIAPNPLFAWAWANGVPSLEAASGADKHIAARLKKLAPDVLCVAAFPRILAAPILETAALSAVNVHPSLLPRHRGAAPLFWIYYHDDRETGVTVHLMNERADSGAILAQESFELPRGLAIDRLHARSSTIGAALLLQVLERLEAGCAKALPQDERFATKAPRVDRSAPMVNFAEWNAERVWHFLSGLCPRFREPLVDAAGKKVQYASVLGYEEGACGFPAGSVRRASHGWTLHCRDGAVHLGDAPARRIERA